MRKIYDPTENFVIGVRSDYNGPALIEEYKTSTVLEDDPFYLYYKVAKPYSRYTGSLTEPRYASVTDGLVDINFYVPEAFKIIEATMAEAERQFSVSVHDLFSEKAYVINRALERSQAYGDLLMLVSASEAKQTVRMIRTVFIRLFRIVLDIYNKVKKLDVFGTLDVVTDIWLEYRYGWTPLIGELGAIKEALTVIRPNGIKSAYATDKPNNLLREVLEIPNVYVSDTITDCVFDAYIWNVGEVTRKAGFNYINKPQSRNDSWSAIFGVDIDSLASTAWELIPFSFIIDMFFNFGSLLQTRDFTDQVDSFNGWMTCRLNGELQINFKEIKTKSMYRNPTQEVIPSTVDQFQALLANLPFVRMAEANFRQRILNWDPSYAGYNYSLDQSDRERIRFGGYGTTKTATEPKAGTWTRTQKIDLGKEVLIQHLTVPQEYFPDRPFSSQYLRDQLMQLYCRPAIYSTDAQNDVAVAYFDFMFETISPSTVQANLDAAYALKLNGVTAYSLRDESHELNGYLKLIENHGKKKYGGADYYIDIKSYKQRLSQLSISDPTLLEQFNQSIDIQLLDRVLMPEFKQAFTADMDLSSAQIADLTAFAFKLGNYFRNLK